MAISSLNLCLVFISLILLFFACPGLSLSHSRRCPSHESHALLRFKASFNHSDYSLNSWVNGTDCCAWEGILCDNHTNHVVSVELYDLYEQQGFFNGLMSESFCQLRFLKSLSIEALAGTKILSPCLENLSHMESLDLYGNDLSGMIPSFLCFLTRLTHLDLGGNMLNGSIPACLGNLSFLIGLGLSYNQLSGTIPSSLVNLSSLTGLYLSGNQFSGSIPTCLCNLPSLTRLELNDNQFSGSIPPCLANLSSLNYLDLSDNELSGSIPPSFAQLSFLDYFFGVGNHFNETILSSSLPSSLLVLRLSLNQSVPETFFHNLTKLWSLYLSDCVLNISKSWIPSFQLLELHLVSCVIDDEIPPWITTQFSLITLGLVNTGLVGQIPSWIWETFSMLQNLNLSGNHLEGRLFSNASVWMQLETLDVSRNELSGHIPSIWFLNMTLLFLNDNLFSGNIPQSLGRSSHLCLLNLANNNLTGIIPQSLGKLSYLLMLNLANNNFTGIIPLTLSKCSSLLVLNLGNNSLEGSLPQEFSKLTELYSLVVHSNKLNGSLPSSIANCSELQVLDIGSNSFCGEIPTSLINLSNLRVLVMKENNFTGSIPLELGQLINLQILLLSSNHISGSIPHSIISLQAMSTENQNGHVLSTLLYQNGRVWSNFLYHDGLDMTLKGGEQHYTYILSTLTSIDLSNNELEGEIASNFGQLKGLRLLNLSRNNFNGTIPNSLGGMSQLESLDLSQNNFSGRIPAELEFLNSLGSLNLSNNNLSGSIPQGRHIGTFEESSYSGNPNLWGCPLPRNCSWPQFAPPTLILVSEGNITMKYSWYKIAVGLSYGAAFGGIMSLILIKMNWRRKYFNKVDTILKFLFPWMKNWTL